jgi:hypothetical protein
MRFKEIIAETTTSGAVATVAMPMGSTQTRGGSLMSGKYTTDLTPNTPKEYKRNKHARGQFKNSISN